MSADDPWGLLEEELDRWAAESRIARLWLRDDDAIAPTPALDRLLDVTGRYGIPLLLGVIPMRAGPPLARRLREPCGAMPCQHGAWHRNHAGPGEKPVELGSHRPAAQTLAEIAEARERMDALFGDQHRAGVLIPPWNRIAPGVVDRLPTLGFDTLSALGPPRFRALREINCDVDIMDWKGPRQGHDAATLVPTLCAFLKKARAGHEPAVGILSHHLAHGEPAWAFLETLVRRTCTHPGATWAPFEAL